MTPNNIENKPQTNKKLSLNCDAQQHWEINPTLTQNRAQAAIPNNTENIKKLTQNLAQAASHNNIDTHSQQLTQHIA